MAGGCAGTFHGPLYIRCNPVFRVGTVGIFWLLFLALSDSGDYNL
ncbi:hypothetical protein LZ24_03371 [Desulfobotulus alkaliphilus]|uniref:Uncharacterized protein n=1 Tax=Desulfobotulus alkaliphilus TaxID=622671 RepID=A0A562R0A0_9BACT|nr:hypothetical protein LZ24_03371 [Desulfobotulus alkaliphilus]